LQFDFYIWDFLRSVARFPHDFAPFGRSALPVEYKVEWSE